MREIGDGGGIIVGAVPNAGKVQVCGELDHER